MESWMKVSLILCTFGFLKELRPSEPFVTEYIVEHKNITRDEVIHIAFPWSTYASLGSLVVVLLITDLLRYKPIVILEGLCHVLVWGILVLAKDLTAVIIAEIFYGVACSAEVGYSTYIYAQVEKDRYKRVTSHISSARLAGKFFGGLVAQLLIASGLSSYHELNYITVACVSVGAFCTLFLPNVSKSHEFYFKSPVNKVERPTTNELASRPLNDDRDRDQGGPHHCHTAKLKGILSVLYKDFRDAYSNSYVLKWSLWWALASAGQYQVLNYIQALWDTIREEGGTEQVLYNGAVKAIHTLLSALLSFGIGYVNISWDKHARGEISLTLISIVQGGMLLWMATTNNLNLAYLTYIIFRTIHPVMITVASAEISQRIPKDSYALIFGVNTFIALLLQTLLTIVVADFKGFALNERNQYIVYGTCFIALGILIGVTTVYTLCSNACTATTSTHHKPSGGRVLKFSSVTQVHDEEKTEPILITGDVDDNSKV